MSSAGQYAQGSQAPTQPNPSMRAANAWAGGTVQRYNLQQQQVPTARAGSAFRSAAMPVQHSPHTLSGQYAQGFPAQTRPINPGMPANPRVGVTVPRQSNSQQQQQQAPTGGGLSSTSAAATTEAATETGAAERSPQESWLSNAINTLTNAVFGSGQG